MRRVVPVHQEAGLERPDGVAFEPNVGVAPVAEEGLTDKFDADVVSAEEADVPVDDQDRPVVSEVDPEVDDLEKARKERDGPAAGLDERSEEVSAHASAPDGLIDEPDGYAVPRPVGEDFDTAPTELVVPDDVVPGATW